MTIFIEWLPSHIGDATKIITIEIEVAALDVYMLGNVIQKTVWHCPQQSHFSENESALTIPIKNYLQNPDSTLLNIELLEQGTVFRHRVWDELCKIPFGQTITYSKLAHRLGSGPRAVASACKNNPFPGIIPCHRVVSVSGIGGFMGQKQGEFIDLKRKLLEYEAALLGQGNA